MAEDRQNSRRREQLSPRTPHLLRGAGPKAGLRVAVWRLAALGENMCATVAIPNDDELLEQQNALRAQAKAFLEAHQVEAVLAPAGRVLLVGSFVTGLMVWRDLDICVDARGLAREAAWELVRPLVLASDRVRYEHLEEPDDRRHYFVLRLDHWKLDLSLFTHGIPPEVEPFQVELMRWLDDETRLVILRLKEAWRRRPEYPEVVSAFEIYESVLEGVRTEAELDEALRRRGLI